ncbi:hypothetical protein [Chryseobacterium sp. JUb7]|uniref:hypothetical protein n=1 Tax=Chryseobacterium sp. JUb7 TaxID=2940599 RepID=UPI0021695885|nr:hypothetical protein [Chryseobacterium sp. JUb7]MCS3528679.1 hypothetical protein [Chryseobacterium sp. JUb7]
MLIDTIYQSIKNWKTLSDSYKNGNEKSGKEIMRYLNQGSHFSVEGKNIAEWKKNLENESEKTIHAYLGIDEDQLKFFLIDAKSDADADFSTVIIKQFNRSSPENPLMPSSELISNPPITSEAAVYRNFRFNMYGSAWLETQKSEPFRLISIPFDDYERMNLTDDESCTCFFGLTNETLKDSSIADYHIEIITVKNIGIDTISLTAENYSTPRPPFSANDPVDNYQLLLKSDAYV